ncbi:hypothetical protein [Bacillus sp. NPDC094106]|uniref:hypothetical protein n=1 Tax=Bacillus sp. NPDC094106 TaxID=3363949 RepID=UPI00381AD4D1
MIAKKLHERASKNNKEMTSKKYIDFLIRMAETEVDKGAYSLTVELDRKVVPHRN